MLRRPTRPGQVSLAWLTVIASVLLLTGLVALLAFDPNRQKVSGRPLRVYCAAGIRQPVEAAARAYEQEFSVRVELEYGGSQTLLAKMALSKVGDLYIPADDSYVDLARKRELIDEVIPLADMTPVLAVHAGNPKQVRSLADLLERDLRVAQANPDAAAVGKLTRELLLKAGQWKALEKRTAVFKATVNDVANDIKLGAVDAGIVWDATVRQYPELQQVEAPELAGQSAHISVAVMRSCDEPPAALRFARYLAAPERGLPEFERSGFRPVEGDAWEERPQLKLFAGAMLRPAIQQTIEKFNTREGVEVLYSYNGCGILVGDMKVGKHPDAYFACDKSFMVQVQDLFLDSVDVSTNRLVIVVPRGNPHGIHSLEDLGKPGLRVGVGHEKQCAMGALTEKTLTQSKLQKKVRPNICVESPTGDLLVTKLRAGALDAIIAYVSNAKEAEKEVETIDIDIPCALAIQPVAIAKDSQHKQLTQRLLNLLRSQQSRERFEASGFHWGPSPGAK
jgi:molybdenum ABC transporter molybdate-binding protein